MTNSVPTNRPASSDSQNKVDSMLTVVSMAMKMMSEDAKHSIELRKQGINTAMAEGIETALANPVKNMLEFGGRINDSVSEVLHKTVITHFKEKKSLIQSAYFEKNQPLHFFLVLNEDSIKTRSNINSFFDWYYLESYSDLLPIVFTYLTPERVDKVEGVEVIELSDIEQA